MKLLGHLLLACVVLAAIRAAVTALLVMFGIGMLAATIRRPRETGTLILGLALITVVAVHPWVIVVAIAAGATCSLLAHATLR